MNLSKDLERQLIEDIEQRQRTFFDSQDGRILRALAAKTNPAALYNCYYVNSIPDQGEDYHVFLVDAHDVFKFSVDRQTRAVVLEERYPKPARWQAENWGRDGQMVLKLARLKKAALKRDMQDGR